MQQELTEEFGGIVIGARRGGAEENGAPCRRLLAEGAKQTGPAVAAEPRDQSGAALTVQDVGQKRREDFELSLALQRDTHPPMAPGTE